MNSYDWVPFYKEFANRLLEFQDNREELITIIRNVFSDIDLDLPTLEKNNEMIDIDPFTVVALFNKGMTTENRRKILTSFTNYLTLEEPVPTSFRSIPVLMSLNATFYDFIEKRQPEDINNLWKLFEFALAYAANETEENKKQLTKYYNLVIQQGQIGNAKISMGLFWIAPNTFLNLDGTNVEYIYESNELPVEIVDALPTYRDKMNAKRYFEIMETMEEYIASEKSEVNNLQELSYAAWEYSKEKKKTARDDVGAGLPDSGSESPHYWIYSPGPGSRKWDEFYDEGVMAIGWSEFGDLNQYQTRAEMTKTIQELRESSSSFKNTTLATWEFANEMKIGDVIFAKKGTDKIIGWGIVDSDYYYDAEVKDDFKNRRQVNWKARGEWDHPGKAVLKTLTDLTIWPHYVEKLKNLVQEDSEEEIDDALEVTTQYDEYSREKFLNEVFMEESKYDKLVALLDNKKNIILQGPPGVGKTYMAKRLAYSMIGERNIERVEMVQFHQSYSYEDFIEGFRPEEDGKGFEIKKGSFYEFCRKAEKDIENAYFFIIDEINRGNLSKIFGELLMLIENDKRGHQLQLLYSDDKFSVPSNVYIIGMMNTADRSLAILDYALRRRFAFYDLKPAFQSSGFKNYQQELASPTFDSFVRTIEQLNQEIENDQSLGSGFAIGHSYLSNLKTAEGYHLENIVEYEILPLIREYWFDESNKVREWEEKLRRAIQ